MLLRTCLVFLALGVLVLVLVAWWSFRQAFREAEQMSWDLGRLLANQVERMLEAADLMLIYTADVATSVDWQDREQAAAAHAKLQDLGNHLSYALYLWVFDADGRARTSSMPALPQLNVVDRDYFQRHRNGEPGPIITPVTGRVTGSTILVMTRRLADRQGNFAGIVLMSMFPRDVGDYYRALNNPYESTFQLLGPEMEVLVEEPAPAAPGSRLAPEIEDAIRSGAIGVLTAPLPPDGRRMIWAHRTVGTLPLHVNVGIPVRVVTTQWLDRIWPYLAFAALALAALSLLTAVAVRRARNEDQASAELLESKLGLQDRVNERTASLQAALQQKEVLFRELNHRVKNNLQLISSFLRLQASAFSDPAVSEGFERCLTRIQSMGLMHELLYRDEEIGSVPFSEYLELLCRRHSEMFGEQERVRIAVEADAARYPPDATVSLALIINELVVNALKHAFPDGRSGTIMVRFEGNDAGGRLSVEDDGIGFSEAPDSESLGLQIVEVLAKQLGATLQRSPRPGGSATVLAFQLTGG